MRLGRVYAHDVGSARVVKCEYESAGRSRDALVGTLYVWVFYVCSECSGERDECVVCEGGTGVTKFTSKVSECSVSSIGSVCAVCDECTDERVGCDGCAVSSVYTLRAGGDDERACTLIGKGLFG